MDDMEGGRGASALLIVALGAMMALGCNDTNIIGPDNQLEVDTAADNFEFQVSNLNEVTQTLDYDWENTGGQATIDISQSITAGSVIVTISDADGTVVHQEDLRQDNDTDTAAGSPGLWRIQLRLDGVSGTFNFRVQKKT